MEQGENVYENVELPVSPNDIDAMLLTHAHIDHSGHIPLYRQTDFPPRFIQQVQLTAFAELCLWIQRTFRNLKQPGKQKNKRSGKEPVEPLYTTQDVQNALKYFTPCEYNETYQIFDGIEIKFIDAGHLLGSSSIQIKVTENSVTKLYFFRRYRKY